LQPFITLDRRLSGREQEGHPFYIFSEQKQFLSPCASCHSMKGVTNITMLVGYAGLRLSEMVKFEL